MSKITKQQIDTLYKNTSKEIPSEKINSDILNFAKNDSKTNKFKKYQSWYIPISTAASIVLVSLLYINDKNPYLEHSTEFNEKDFNKKKKHVEQELILDSSEQIQTSDQKPKLRKNSAAPSVYKLENSGPTALGTQQLNKIDKLIKQGKLEQAKIQIKRLISQYPQSKHTLEDKYADLLKSTD
ncbi:hypothetical protein [Pseudoalteromonas denitrificans]|uniref:Uncharacterized protein n=1 Tax=Pseudoalteromonas denitrificans DSM 6059 TaxID=1123010 RepID=A0A1I1FEC6_9GAMM|nr:hypothetical protein [Pseudoalteromonas denitrificans]SFB97296.1 hypothetical protein SAMN02745724_00591 [Pseudoalteromonas denitrificans DSM 6059]